MSYPTILDDLREWWAAEAGRSRAVLRLWAERNAPHVPLEKVDAIAGAVGEISIREAHRALERLEAEHRQLAGTRRTDGSTATD